MRSPSFTPSLGLSDASVNLCLKSFPPDPSLISSGSFCQHFSQQEGVWSWVLADPVEEGDFGGSESTRSQSRRRTDGSGLGCSRVECSGCQLQRAVGTKEMYIRYSLSPLFPRALGYQAAIILVLGWVEPRPFTLKTLGEGPPFWGDAICLRCFQEGFS